MRVTFILVLAVVLAAICVLAIDQMEWAAAESVDQPGPQNVGFYYDEVKTSTKVYPTPVLVYYPAYDSGESTQPDNGSGPYPAVVFLPFFGGDRNACADITNRLASWGFIVLAVSVNWNDFPYSGNASDVDDLLDYLEAQDANTSSRLHGMLDAPMYGISGYSSGGGLALLSGGLVGRIAAVQTLAAAVGVSAVDTLAPYYDQPVQLQVGQEDADYIAGSRRAYQKFTCARSLVEILRAGHGGPFDLGLFVAFYLYHLRGVCGMYDYVYGRNAVEGAANGRYDLYFNISATIYFPPVVSVRSGPASLLMDQEGEFEGDIAGYFPLDHDLGAFEWDFDGDGSWDSSHRTLPEARHSFTEPGTFYAQFSYKLGRLRYLATGTVTVRVENVPPVAVASGDASVRQDATASFHSYGSSDTPSDRPRLEFSWDFGDGATSERSMSPIAEHVYTARDTYTVTLTVRDPHGGTATAILSIVVVNVAPTVEAGQDWDAVEDAPVQLSAVGNDTPSDVATLWYRWDFGDGLGTDWSTSPSATHAYAAAMTYVATVTVRDSARDTESDTLTVVVRNLPPSCTIEQPASRATVPMDEPVRFVGSWSDTPSDLDALLCRWDFGDGAATEWARSSTMTVTHVYTDPGVRTVVLSTVDSDGAQADYQVVITVLNAVPVATVLRPGAQATVAEGLTLLLEGTAEDTASDSRSLVLEWVVDGRVVPGQRAIVSFNTSGAHEAVLRAADRHGAVGEARVNITVRNLPPEVMASVGPLAVLVGEWLNLTAEGDDTPSDRSSLSVEWDLGDGNVSSEWSLAHNYSRAGTYRVTVTVTDDDNETASATFTVVVSERPAPPPPPPPTGEGERGFALSSMMLVGIGVVVAVVLVAAALLVMADRGARGAS